MVPYYCWRNPDHIVFVKGAYRDHLTIAPDYQHIQQYLSANHAYYQKLQKPYQAKFVQRVLRFIENKSISGRQGLELTNEIEILLASSAIQLTLGLETWDLSYFNTIFIYPSEYKNPNTGQMHKGETHLGGMVCFSWRDFLAGNANPTDKINLGLHEFAHALRFNSIKGNDSDYFFENYFPRWTACAAKEFSRMQNNISPVFRKYGSVNINEFFSVVVETFFESPQEFKNAFSDLYKHTAILLNQYVSDDGMPVLNCREDLMSNASVHLKHFYDNLLKHNLRSSSSIIMVIGFGIVGLFSLRNEGYLFPSPYICLGLSALFWLYLEKNYTRLFLANSRFKLKKGFFLLQGYSSVELPLTKLVSIIGNGKEKKDASGNEYTQLDSLTITYYDNGYFYEEEISCTADTEKFELLCKELRQNHVHVFIQNTFQD